MTSEGAINTKIKTRMGEIQVGPLGLLDILETQLGIPSQEQSLTVRTVDYLACLKKLDSNTAFYNHSLAVDEFNVAAELLVFSSGHSNSKRSQVKNWFPTEQVAYLLL